MSNNKEVSKETAPANKLWQYIKKNGFTVLMVILIGVMFVSPNAKSFMLRQLMATGLFNASIDTKVADSKKTANVDFDFSDENGGVQNTSSLRGKVVFINFWASWCPPCRAELPSIETLYSKFKDNPDVFFLTVNQDDDLATGRAYLKKEKYAVPLFTVNGNVPKEVYAGVLPTTVVLDKSGKIRYHNAGFANYASDKFLKQIEELIKE